VWLCRQFIASKQQRSELPSRCNALISEGENSIGGECRAS
jgi:hypothetical protein